jgi:tape measure domain-containing protein
MARNLDTAIRISAEVKGGGNIDRVKRSLQDLSKSSQVSARQIDQLFLETQKLSRASNGSVNALNQQKAALESLRNSVNPASRRFVLLSQDIARVSASLKEADAAAAGFGLAAALTTSTTAAAAGMVSFGGFTASTQSVAAALSRMGVSGSKASEMLRALQGDTSGTVVTTQKLNLALNQAFASTPEKAAAQINTMRQALAQLKIGSEDYLKALVRVNEAEAVNQARTGRASVIAANRAYAGPTMTGGYGSDVRLPGLPNTMAADMQRVSELTARVNNLDRATDEYRRSLQELEVVQRRLNARPERRGSGLREAAGGAAGVLAMGGGPMGAIGAVGGSLAASGGAAGLLAAGGISIGAGVGALASRVGVEAETAQVRLKALADQFGEFNEAQASAARIAATLRISQIEAADGFSKLYAALRPTGITLQEVEDAFIGFTAAARASGATAQESSFALLQLKQALGAGVLQGDELRSIREQAPAVGQAIAKEMGVTIGELKKLGSEGKITTDIVIRALAKLRGEKLGQLQAQFNTSAQAMKDLQVATENFGATVARIFGPTTVALIRGVTAALQYANELTQNPFERARQLERGQQQVGPSLTAEQQQARVAAAAEREAARARAAAATQQAQTEKAAAATKERATQEDSILQARLDGEKRLAEFREQSIKRAGELEQDLARQRLELDRNTAEARRQIENQRRDAELEVRRQQLSAAGLSTSGVDVQRRLNEATQRFTEQQIQIQEQATDRKVEIERAVEDYKVSVAEGIRDILVDASEKMAANMQKGAAMAGGLIARTGNTGQSTGPHLDARWADGRRISAADADRYLSVNGRNPSSFGVTSGYGPRNLFGRSFHKGIDFGTPSGSGITLKNGASLLRDLGFTGAGGYAVEIDTPQGRMRLLHLQAGSAARPSAAPARASAAIATGPAPGMDRIEGGRRDLLAALGQNSAAQTGANFGELINSRRAEVSGVTQELDQQKRTSREQLADFQRMVELQRSGLSPEIAKQRVDLERTVSIEREGLQLVEAQLRSDLQISGLTAKNKQLLEGQLAAVQARQRAQPEIVNGLTAEQQQLEQLQASYERNKQLAEGVAGTIGGGLSSAMDLLIEGTDNWGNSLKEIASGVLKDIARQLMQTMVIAPIVKGITKGFGFADGGIMSPSGPLPLKTYSRGGIANSPQLALYGEGSMNEAYVPLPDGRRIPVALQGGSSGTTIQVEVNVDASGNSNVSGDAGKAEQLGRMVSRAVQAELIRQKQPGGLLTK